MRLWSLHPKYLDSKGLVALWREGLLAKKVLEGKTRGYINHPQLLRFKHHQSPLLAINQYLFVVLNESQKRGYNFDQKKLDYRDYAITKITISSGQLEYEFAHLMKKLKQRNLKRYHLFQNEKNPQQHPLFEVTAGEIETWEIR